MTAEQRAEVDAALWPYGARLTDGGQIAKEQKTLSVAVDIKGKRLRMLHGGSPLATYPATKIAHAISDFVEKFWFWKKIR